jgi:hypothetical protein
MTALQAHIRGYLVRRIYHDYIRRVIIVQCQVRRFLAKRQLKKLKVRLIYVAFNL